MKRAIMTAAACGFAATLFGCQTTGSLGGTNWTVVEVLSTDRDVVAMDVDFDANGMATATWTEADGITKTARHQYGVYENSLLIIRRPETGDLHLLHRVDGDQLYLTSETFHARLVRTN